MPWSRACDREGETLERERERENKERLWVGGRERVGENEKNSNLKVFYHCNHGQGLCAAQR